MVLVILHLQAILLGFVYSKCDLNCFSVLSRGCTQTHNPEFQAVSSHFSNCQHNVCFASCPVTLIYHNACHQLNRTEACQSKRQVTYEDEPPVLVSPESLENALVEPLTQVFFKRALIFLGKNSSELISYIRRF